MGWFDKLKEAILGKRLPEETRRALEESDDARQTLSRLDSLITRNEMEIRRLNRELGRLEEMESSEKKKLKAGEVGERAKRTILRTIQRLRTRMDALENRITIYERNVNLHLMLIGRLQQAEAMKAAGVSEDEVSEVMMDFESEWEAYEEVMEAARSVQPVEVQAQVGDEKELKALEEEILAEAGKEEARPKREKAPRGKAAKKREEPEAEAEE